jgi:hypothetical protein
LKHKSAADSRGDADDTSPAAGPNACDDDAVDAGAEEERDKKE